MTDGQMMIVITAVSVAVLIFGLDYYCLLQAVNAKGLQK